ncbi:MAG: DUF705 domain-containing protein [bacterium]
MRIVFDMDNTLVDELGATLRPGIVELLERLKAEKHTLILWTSSAKWRATTILKDHGLSRFFSETRFRENYDPDNTGRPKDIREVKGDILIDDDPKLIAYLKTIGKPGFLISAFRQGVTPDPEELHRLYQAIAKAGRWWRKILG